MSFDSRCAASRGSHAVRREGGATAELVALAVLAALVAPGAWPAGAVTQAEATGAVSPARLSREAPFGAQQPTLYVVGTAHLDTQWRWTVRDVIREYLPATLRENFALFESHPRYRFSFEGAFRYALIKEYYPDDYARMRDYIASDRWHVAGSWIDAVDVNLPAPESLIRQTLYGNGFFRREFDLVSRDVFLPDCFGFGHALPSVAAHCGLLGFSTQKLTWGSAVGVPFDIGLWEGVDGARLVAALAPGAYVSRIEHDLSRDSTWIAAVARQGARSGFHIGYKYFGTGDQGGAPAPSSVAWLERSLDGDGPLTVESVASDALARRLARLLPGEQTLGLYAGRELGLLGQLPRYRGELLMTDHGAGCYTSQAAMKRWNRKNELRADAAERSAVAAYWLGGLPYPRQTLTDAWWRFLWHQFHDDLPGTSIPAAYTISWNDELLSLGEFAEVERHAVGTVSRAMDTGVRGGEALLVYNPLGIERSDVVTARVRFDQGVPRDVRVYDGDGREVPAQAQARGEDEIEVVFVAAAPPVGYAVYELRPSHMPSGVANELSVTRSSLENARYRVTLDRDGNVASIHDKRLERELLDGPLELQLLDNTPREWPAWEIDYDDLQAEPRRVVGRPAEVRIVEEGPARATLAIERQADGSRFVQYISLAAGAAGSRVEIRNEIDWRTPRTLLKASFPLAVEADSATYDLRLGTIERGLNRPALYEVPAQQWAGLSDAGGGFGVAVLSNARYGWDRPNARTLRHTLIHTPGIADGWGWVGDQASQDLGRHHAGYALYGHAGDWRAGAVAWEAERFNQPLRAYQVPRHRGPLGRRFAFLELLAGEAGPGAPGTAEQGSGAGATDSRRAPHPPAFAVRALKLAEDGDEIVVRVQELLGRHLSAAGLQFARPIATFREVNGAEEEITAPAAGPSGGAHIAGGALRFDLAPYQLRTFALRIDRPDERLGFPQGLRVPLPYNLDGIAERDDPTDGDFDQAGHLLAGELLPPILMRHGVAFWTGPRAPGYANVVACQGQRVGLPEGDFDQLYLLAATVDGDRDVTFTVEPAFRENYTVELHLQDWAAEIGQWDQRMVMGTLQTDPAAIQPGYRKPATVGWVGTHRYDRRGRAEPYTYSYAFLYRIDLPHETRAIHLPDDQGVRVLAATVARNPNDVARSATPLEPDPHATVVTISAADRLFLDALRVRLDSPTPGAVIRYTLDGRDPDAGSPVYTGPFELTATTTVKARAFAPGLADTYVARATFERRTPRPAVAAPHAPEGLRVAYYEGAWERMPAWEEQTPVRTFVASGVELPAEARPEQYGLRFCGYVRVPREGIYTFHLSSDDGSRLHLGDELLIDNDGLHGKFEMSGQAALAAGWHPLRVEYFQGPGDAYLALEWEGPGFARAPIGSGALRQALP